MGCSIVDPGACITDVINGVVSGVFNELAAWMGSAATAFLNQFSSQFVSIKSLDLSGGGIDQIYGMSLGIAGSVAAIILMVQVAKTLWTRSGEPIVQALIGLAKVALAFSLTLTVGTSAMQASDELTAWIVQQSMGNEDAFGADVGKVLALGSIDVDTEGALLFVFALLVILVVLMLWVELILRNAALAVLIATSPIAASGMLADMPWWSKTVRASIQLIVLKPMIALIFALGFSMGTDSSSVGTTQVITGFCILALAVVAWPALAKFMTWGSAMASSAGGVGAALGFLAGRAGQGSGGGEAVGSPAGAAEAGESAQATGVISRATAAVSAGASAAGAAAVRAAAVAVSAGPAMMDQMAGHAGLAHPSTRIGSGPSPAARARGGGGGGGAEGGAAQGETSTAQGEAAEPELAQTAELPRLSETAEIPVIEESGPEESGNTRVAGPGESGTLPGPPPGESG